MPQAWRLFWLEWLRLTLGSKPPPTHNGEGALLRPPQFPVPAPPPTCQITWKSGLTTVPLFSHLWGRGSHGSVSWAVMRAGPVESVHTDSSHRPQGLLLSFWFLSTPFWFWRRAWASWSVPYTGPDRSYVEINYFVCAKIFCLFNCCKIQLCFWCRVIDLNILVFKLSRNLSRLKLRSCFTTENILSGLSGKK